jgi:hypothetical protein
MKLGMVRALEAKPDYDHDGMRLYGKSLDFLSDPRFMAAYRAGMNTGHHILRAPGSDDDIHNEYRVYLCCWAARHAARLPGDFVECGVNTGITSVAICTYLNFNETKKRFYLFDTYQGIPLDQATAEELPARSRENERNYEECFELAKRNFAPWSECVLVRGRIPESVALAPAIHSISFIQLDR